MCSWSRLAEQWLIKSVITADRPTCSGGEPHWTFLCAGLAEHSRMIGEPKGVEYRLWLEGDVLHVQLVLRPERVKRLRQGCS